jgi:hypothetical protein
VDRCKTKTGDDRRIQLCPRALSVLKRQLRLRARLVAPGKIDHDHVFFLDSGEPLQNLQCPQIRWRKTLQSLKLRYRRPYTSAKGLDILKKAVAADPTLSADVKTEAEANDAVTKGLRNVLDFVSYFIGSLMGLGAVCGGSICDLVESAPAQDHRHTPLHPRFPRLRLLRPRDMKDVRLPPPRRERVERRPQCRSGIQSGLQLLGNRTL